ncbi:hypothetical protein CCR75_004304 [Bremia lactucae]|uniref:Uncharacterized protein n=1 Tax=Bremia lactucae TaxID=4779 RepID=A0A976II06_BRELC|nr:hypothetical protein CCR75_004304 [Bremia lactucae]
MAFKLVSDGRLVMSLVLTSVAAVNLEATTSSSSLAAIYIVIAVLIILIGILIYFVWKRQQNRKRDNRSYNLPTSTAQQAVTRVPTDGNLANRQRGDSVGHPRDSTGKKALKSRQQRIERPPQWPANGAPTYTRQQQQRSSISKKAQFQQQTQYDSRYSSQRDSQYQPQLSLPPPPPPPPEVPMLEPKEYHGPSLSMLELQQSQVEFMQSNVDVVHRHTDPEVIARTQETVEKVMAELEEDPEFEESWIPYTSLYFTRAISKGAFGEVWLAQLENTQVLADRCLDANPDVRPDAPELLSILRDIQKEL